MSEEFRKRYYLCVSSSYQGVDGLQNLRNWLEKRQWGLTKNSKIISYIQPEDEMAFYIPGSLKSVVATAKIVTGPELPLMDDFQISLIHWIVGLDSIRWFNQPIKLDMLRRQSMDALQGYKHWAWFLQSGTRVISAHDFKVLTLECL